MSAQNSTNAPALVSFTNRQVQKAVNAITGNYGPILDWSRYQAPANMDITWDRGVRLLIFRLSVGDYYKDIEFDNFYATAKAKGFKIGAYHVTKPSISVSKQWAKVIESLGGRELDIPLILDNELDDLQNPTTISNVIEGLSNEARAYFDPYYPIQYLRGYWWNQNTIYKPIFGKCPLFIARYTGLLHPWNDDLALKPRDWNDWDIWQHSADGNGLGAYYGVTSASVDIDRGNANSLEETLARLHKTDVIEPPPAPIEPVLMKAHIKPTSTPYVRRRASPRITASTLGYLYPKDNVWVTKLYPVTPEGSQWVEVIQPKGGDGSNDVSGFCAFTYQYNDLLAWGWV